MSCRDAIKNAKNMPQCFYNDIEVYFILSFLSYKIFLK